MNEFVFGRDAFLALVDAIDLTGKWGEENADMPWLQIEADGVYLVPPPPGMFVGITWPEIKTLYNLTDGPEAPTVVLKFPFSKDAFLEFMDRFGLDDDCSFVASEAISKKWHTVEKVAERLGIESEDVFNLLKSGEISPSVYLTEPILVKEIRGDGSLDRIVGLFEVEGLRGLQWAGFKVLGFNLFRILVEHEELGVIDDSVGPHCREFMSVLASDPCNSKAIVDHSFLKSQIVVSDESLRNYTMRSKAAIPVSHRAPSGTLAGTVPEEGEAFGIEDRMVFHAEAAPMIAAGEECNLPVIDPTLEEAGGDNVGNAEQEQSKKIKSELGRKLAKIKNECTNNARKTSASVVMGLIDEALRIVVDDLRAKKKAADLTICIKHFWDEAILSGAIPIKPSYRAIRPEIVAEFKAGGRYSGYKYWSSNPDYCERIKVAEK